MRYQFIQHSTPSPIAQLSPRQVLRVFPLLALMDMCIDLPKFTNIWRALNILLRVAKVSWTQGFGVFSPTSRV